MQLHAKVKWSLIAGALVTVIVWILSLVGVDVPPFVASALVVVISGRAGYQAPNEGPMEQPQAP